MSEKTETIEDIIREMRDDAVAADAWCETHGEMASAAPVLNRHADRILAAHKREMAHNESLLQKAGATVVELMNTMSAQHEEIKKLRAALKPVLEVEWHKVWNGPDGWNEYGDPLPSQAVKESQRIYKEVGNEER